MKEKFQTILSIYYIENINQNFWYIYISRLKRVWNDNHIPDHIDSLLVFSFQDLQEISEIKLHILLDLSSNS